MKKIMIGIVVVLCAVLFVSAAFAGEKGSEGNYWAPWFKPALYVGYAFDANDPEYTFTTRGLAPLGLTKIDLRVPHLSGVYVAGELPIAITCRFKVALEGSWTWSLATDDMKEVYNGGLARRTWDLDNNSDAVTLNFLASYAFVKDLSFIKDISAVGGLRWDYHSMRFDEPYNPLGVASSGADTIDFRMHTLAPVFGLTSTLKGYKSGIFGGNIKLGLLGGPIVWGHVNYKEKVGGVNLWHFNDDLSSGGYLFKIFGEITALSGKITPAIDGSLSLFAQCTLSKTGGTLDATTRSGATGSFDFDTSSSVVAIGLKAAITF